MGTKSWACPVLATSTSQPSETFCYSRHLLRTSLKFGVFLPKSSIACLCHGSQICTAIWRLPSSFILHKHFSQWVSWHIWSHLGLLLRACELPKYVPQWHVAGFYWLFYFLSIGHIFLFLHVSSGFCWNLHIIGNILKQHFHPWGFYCSFVNLFFCLGISPTRSRESMSSVVCDCQCLCLWSFAFLK